jgi:SAM-dependent methyltransferase
MTSIGPAFTGSVPEIYTQYMGPIFFVPFAEEIARRLHGMTTGHVLETACGTGIVTRALRRLLPDPVGIIATDLNQSMLNHAKTLPENERITWQQANAQSLPFANAAFDIVVTSFGAMFFPDRVGAYQEVHRILRPDGRYIFTVWGALETIDLQFIAHTTVAALYPDDPPDFLRRVPCCYHDTAAIRADTERSGFSDIRIETLDLPSRAASARDAAIGLVRGTPLSAEIVARDPNGLDRAVAATTDAITARFGSGPIEAGMQAHIITLRR